MVVPAVILGASGIAALTGIGAGGSAVLKNAKAHKITEQAQMKYENAKLRAEIARDTSHKSLETLGREKLKALNTTVSRFTADFEKIHSIERKESEGLFELSKPGIGQPALLKMQSLGGMAASVAKGAAGGLGAGALTAIGAYGAASTFGVASTGTSIAALSGITAQNATLAFLGGGALAAGGGGMALGTLVLGGAVAGPAIAILGFTMNASASKVLDEAKSNQWQAEKVIEGLNVVTSLCNAIRDRAVMFTLLLGKLAALLDFHSEKMERILENSGTDYSQYTEEEQGEIAMALSTASALKQLLDTPILTENGSLTVESWNAAKDLKAYIDEVASQRSAACIAAASRQEAMITPERMAARSILLREDAAKKWGSQDWSTYKDKLFRIRTLITVTNGAVKNSDEVIHFFDLSPMKDGTIGIFITEKGLYSNIGSYIGILYEDIAEIGGSAKPGIKLSILTLQIKAKSGMKYRITGVDPSKLKQYLEYAVSFTRPSCVDAAAEDELYGLCTFTDSEQVLWNAF